MGFVGEVKGLVIGEREEERKRWDRRRDVEGVGWGRGGARRGREGREYQMP